MQQEKISTADLYDQYEDALDSICVQFQNFGARTSFSGPARTIKCFEDNMLIKATLNEPGEGHVLVVDGGGSLRFALMGDMIAQAAVDNGWAGVIIFGAIRDREALAGMDLGIKALGSNPRKTVKRGGGFSELSVNIDTVTIRPGAMVYADLDGILVAR